jgi:hypothetical protein
VFRPLPHGVDTVYLVSFDCFGERRRADAENIAAVLNEAASGFDGVLRAWTLGYVLHRVPAILDVPCPCAVIMGRQFVE